MKKLTFLDIFADLMGGALCLAYFIFRNRAITQEGIILINTNSPIFWNLITMVVCLIVISYLLETLSTSSLKNYFICVMATLGIYFFLVTLIRFVIVVDYDPCVTFYLIFQAFVAITIGKKDKPAPEEE